MGAERQLHYICLVLTHVAFDFQCEVQKSFIMTQLLRDLCACVCASSFVEVGVKKPGICDFGSDVSPVLVLHVSGSLTLWFCHVLRDPLSH